jgi:serine/threonine kinase 32
VEEQYGPAQPSVKSLQEPSPIYREQPSDADYFPGGGFPADDAPGAAAISSNKPHRTGARQSSTSPRVRSSTRSASKSGGVQVVLGETGSWSDLANKGATLPAESAQGGHGARGPKQAGMLSLFRGRARSPKPREPGVLGKEGARVVISSGR